MSTAGTVLAVMVREYQFKVNVQKAPTKSCSMFTGTKGVTLDDDHFLCIFD
jgi:hypothetical protein